MWDKLKSLHQYDQPVTTSRYHKPYVEGQQDYYIGISVPDLRKLSKKWFRTITLPDLEKLMTSKIHEYRLLALIILGDQMNKADEQKQKAIVDYYLNHLDYVNNWDLVDLSAYQILGRYLYQIQDDTIIHQLSYADDLWRKRISIIATNHMIRQNDLSLTLTIVDRLLEETHDLLHKANGWMLRNVGDKNRQLLLDFIKKNYQRMPRTTLRYAIEHFPEKERKQILRGEFL